MGYVLLTEEDETLLKQFLEQLKSSRLNRPTGMIEPERDVEEYHTPEVYVAKPQTTIPGISDDVPGQAECNIYRIDVQGGASGEPALVKVGDLAKTVFNLSANPVNADWVVTQRTKYGRWTVWPGSGLARCCLKENHPGYCELFEVYLGVHDPSTRGFTFSTAESNTKWAIDLCYGGPEPDAGARGWFQPMPDDVFGTVYYCVDIDCESPGACDTNPCVETGT